LLRPAIAKSVAAVINGHRVAVLVLSFGIWSRCRKLFHKTVFGI
jgi:hypothetical protein